MTITAAATRTVLMLRLTITLSSLPLSFIPSRAAHQGTLPAKAPSATVRQPVRLCVPSNRSMSPIIARCSDGVEPAPADVEGEASELAKSVADTIEQPGVLLHQLLHQ